jgi:hypothetical protein
MQSITAWTLDYGAQNGGLLLFQCYDNLIFVRGIHWPEHLCVILRIACVFVRYPPGRDAVGLIVIVISRSVVPSSLGKGDRPQYAFIITVTEAMHHLNMHQGQTMSFRGTARQPFCSSQALQPARKHIAHAHKQQPQQQQHKQQLLQQQEAAAQQDASNHWRHLGSQGFNRIAVAAAAAALVFAPMTVAPDAVLAATDTVKVGTCLLQKCQVQLAKCLGDAKCFQNIVCLNTCNDAPDEAGCQIR